MSSTVEITVAGGRSVVIDGGWPPVYHSAGARLQVSPETARQLRASGHAIDPTATLVRVENVAQQGDGTCSVGLGSATPLVNPGTIGLLK